MEFVSTILAWIAANYDVLIVPAAGILYAGALLIVNFTKTPKDNEYLAKAYKVAMIVAGLWTKEAQGLRSDGTPKV